MSEHALGNTADEKLDSPQIKKSSGMGGSIVRAAGIMMVATLASRVLGQLRESLIATWFGQTGYTDIYVAAFSLPDTLFFLLAGGAFSSSYIPVFTQYLHQDREDEAWKVFSIVATFLFIFITALILLGEIFARPLVHLLFPWFDEWRLENTVRLTRIVLPAQLAFFMGGLMMATLYVRGRFLIPALGPIIYNLAIISGGWLLGISHGVAGLCWGALAGAFIGNFFLQMVFLKNAGVRFRPSLNLRHPGIIKIGKLVLPVLLGLSLPQVYVIVNRMFGSGLEHGIITALDQANKLMQAPLGIFAQGIGIAIFPALSALVARGELAQYRATFIKGLRAMWFMTLPLSLLMMVLSREIVAVLLEYGHFNDQNAWITSVALICYCMGLFAFASQALLNRAFYAVQDTVTPVIIGTITTGIFVCLNVLLVKPLGYKGLALAGSVAAVLHTVVMLAALRHKVKIGLRPLTNGFLKFLLAGAFAAGLGWLTRFGILALAQTFGLHHKATAITVLVVVSAISGGSYVLMMHWLGSEELAFVKEILLRRRKRRPT